MRKKLGKGFVLAWGKYFTSEYFMGDEMKKYQIILADPPWSYADQGCQGTMANHYKGMKIEEDSNC